MKILLIGKTTESFKMLPPEVQLNLFEPLVEHIEQTTAKGTLLEFYSTPIGYSVVILNYDSAEKWVEDQKDMPLFSYVDWEIYPLADGKANLKRTLESLRKAVGK